MARIPQHFLDDLLNRIDIVALIEPRVELKRQGREYAACCPFHNEKTPSFTVSPTKQFYHCFGCGAHGNAIDFLMEHDRLEFRDAVEELAKQAGVEIPEEAGVDTSDDRRPLYDAMEKATRHYEQALRDTPRAVDYLKQRGVSGETAQRFRIGYAPSGFEPLPERVGRHSDQTAVGLLARSDSGKAYARFRDRIMFPIRDTRGRVIAFGGRVLPDADDKAAKYMNSPETPLFQKRYHLYGLYEARQAHKRLPRSLVVEGYMDVVMLAQQGIDYAVATLGTATTEEHLDWLFRNTDSVVFCFDGDAAGRRAAGKALEQALPAMRDGRDMAFLFLPEGEDPDSLVQKEGRDAFEARIASARTLSHFLLEQLAEGANLDEPEGRARLVERAREPLAKLEAPAFRSMLISQLAEMAKMPVGRIEDILKGRQGRVVAPTPVKRSADGPSPVRTALRLLLEYPELAQQVDDLAELENSDTPGLPVLLAAIRFFRENPDSRAAAFTEKYRGEPTGEHLAKLLARSLAGNTDLHAEEFSDAMSRLRGQARQFQINLLQSRLERGELDQAGLAELQSLLQTAKQVKD